MVKELLKERHDSWNIPGHMLCGIIAFEVLEQSPQTVDK